MWQFGQANLSISPVIGSSLSANRSLPYLVENISTAGYYEVVIYDYDTTDEYMSSIIYASAPSYYGAVFAPGTLTPRHTYALALRIPLQPTDLAEYIFSGIAPADAFLAPSSAAGLVVLQGNQNVRLVLALSSLDMNPVEVDYAYFDGSSEVTVPLFIEMVFAYNRSSYIGSTVLFLQNSTNLGHAESSSLTYALIGVDLLIWAQPALVTTRLPFSIKTWQVL